MQDIEFEEKESISTEKLGDFQLEINRNDLLKTLSHINGVVEKRNIISILGNVKLEVIKDLLYLTATDMDLAITETIKVSVQKPGTITIPAQMLYDIVRKLGDVANIAFNLDAASMRLNIIAGNCDFMLPVLSAESFPYIECNDVSHSFYLSPSDLKTLISKTKFAISTEETRYNLNGIYLHYLNDSDSHYLVAAATDGHRLSQVKVFAPEGSKNMAGIILPRKASIELSKLVDETKNEVKVEISSSKARFTIDNISFVTKLIDASFPDYQNFIPQNNNKNLLIDRESFAKAVDRVSTLSVEKFNAVKLQLSNGNLDLTVNNEQYGLAHERLLVNYNEDSLDIAFNARYILEIMSVIDGNDILLSFTDSYSPIIIKDAANDFGIYIIMPMRI
jgi:DNA polymerase-3 subunit beta